MTDQLAAAFCERTLPKGQWTHEAHLRVGLWHVLRHPADRALDLLRERISAYNVARVRSPKEPRPTQRRRQ
jgi:hypothetical protein